MIIGKLELVHEDARRKIAEFNSPDEDYSVQEFTIHEEIPLGNHYHTKKFEVFVITKGRGRLLTLPLRYGLGGFSSADSEVEEQDVKAGMVIRIERGIVHTFIMKKGSKMLCFSSQAFNKEDQDIVEHKLV